MARLIDADALIKRLENTSITPVSSWIKAEIINAPTVDERKKGKWGKNGECQFCGFQPWYENDIHTLSFCPNCGSDMRGEQT